MSFTAYTRLFVPTEWCTCWDRIICIHPHTPCFNCSSYTDSTVKVLLINTPPPRPYKLSLACSITSSSLWNLITTATGPKISSRGYAHIICSIHDECRSYEATFAKFAICNTFTTSYNTSAFFLSKFYAS